MKPTDLRIGNIIKWKYGEDNYNAITGVDEEMIGIDTITPFGVEPKDIEPIPITEEWLVRFGLKNGSNEYITIRPFWTATQGYIKGEWMVDFKDSVPYMMKRTIKYIHELQNLYFALTGEELILKQ